MAGEGPVWRKKHTRRYFPHPYVEGYQSLSVGKVPFTTLDVTLTEWLDP